jgi:hypothetical protein
MISFKKNNKASIPIAIIKGGAHDKQLIYLTDDHGTSIPTNPSDNLTDKQLLELTQHLGKKEMNTLFRALKKEKEPDDIELAEIYNKLTDQSAENAKKEIIIYDGRIEPLPSFKKSFRAYVAGPTGSGKSYWCRAFLSHLNKVFPEKKIFIISDVDEDESLDGLKNVIRLKIDNELANKQPIKTDKFTDSVVLFDDIDSIPNKKVAEKIYTLRDSLLRRGRHENASTIVTSHLLTNYKDTRIVLNECSSVTFYPKSGSSYGIKYMLKKYVGLDPPAIKRVMNLPTRSVTIYKNCPLYCVYDSGVFLF